MDAIPPCAGGRGRAPRSVALILTVAAAAAVGSGLRWQLVSTGASVPTQLVTLIAVNAVAGALLGALHGSPTGGPVHAAVFGACAGAASVSAFAVYAVAELSPSSFALGVFLVFCAQLAGFAAGVGSRRLIRRRSI